MSRWDKVSFLVTDSYRGEVFYNLVVEPILQGVGVAIRRHVLSEGISEFEELLRREDGIFICFNMPEAFRKCFDDVGKFYIEFRISPLQFCRDLYLACRSNNGSIEALLQKLAVPDAFLKLEASFLAANINSQRARLERLNTYFHDLNGTTVIVSSDSGYPANDSDIKSIPGLDEYIERIDGVDRSRRILYKPSEGEDPAGAIDWLTDLLGVPVKICNNNSYQLLSFQDDIQLIGIHSRLLQEAKWFSKPSTEFLGLPLTPVDGEFCFKNIKPGSILVPGFWAALLSVSDVSYSVSDFPELLSAREVFDCWGDYEKVLTWSRALPYMSFIRSGGGQLLERVANIERNMHFLGAGSIGGGSKESTPVFGNSFSISSLKGSCAGKTAYVLGNASSLNKLDIAGLLKEDSFWCNRAWEIEKRGIAFRPKYYLFVDALGFKNFSEKVMEVQAGIKFFRQDVFSLAEKTWADEISAQNVIPFNSIWNPGMHEGFFSTDASICTYCGRTVVLDAIQIAAYMGYTEILVGGVDLDYSQPYFFGASVNSRMPENEVIKAFEVARDVLMRQGVSLKKITESPNLPLEYVPSKFQIEV